MLAKLDRTTAARIMRFLDDRVAASGDPRSLGKALTGPEGEFWRYRIGDYRAVARIQDQRVTVLVVRVGHRGTVYRGGR
jgi:mRNA interferase RelE/StbE